MIFEIHQKIRCSNNLFKPVFIYFDGATEKSSSAEKVEKKEVKETATNSPLSDKEKKEILKVYEDTRGRLNEAGRKLFECYGVIQKLPKGEHQDRAQKLYNQAAKILEGSVKNFPVEIGIKTREDVDIAVDSINTQKKQNLLGTLRKNGLDASKVIDQLYLVEDNAEKILKDLNRIKSFGLNDQEALTILSCWKTKEYPEALTNFLTYSQKTNISDQDIVKLWIETSESNSLVERVQGLQKVGIKENFAEAMQISLRFGNERAKAAVELKKEGFTNIQALEVLNMRDNDQDFFKKAIALKLPYGELYDLYFRPRRGYTKNDILQTLEKMKNAGVTTNLNEIYAATIDDPDSDYKKISLLLKLPPLGLKREAILEFSKLSGDAQNLCNFIKVFRENGNTSEQITAFYNVERNIDKVQKYVDFLGSQKLSASTFAKLYPVVPDIEEFEELLPIAKEIEERGMDRINSIYLAKEIAAKTGYESGAISKVKEFLEVTKLTNFINEFKNTAYKNNEDIVKNNRDIVFLYKISNGDIKDARNLLHSFNDSIIEMVDAGIEKTIPSIELFLKEGIAISYIIRNWKYWKHSENPDEALRLFKFRQEFPELFAHFSGGPEDCVKSIALYNQQSGETQFFLKHMIESHINIPFENLRGFLEDETLPLCVEVYQNLNPENGDIETAMRFGRSLFYQGYKTVPEKTVFDQKFKEFQELQSESDEIKLFEGRNILFAANGETWSNGGSRFNSMDLHERLTTSAGPNGSFTAEGPSSNQPTVEELKKVKNAILAKLATTPPPMTFYFNGHGGPHGLYINNGQVVGSLPQGVPIDYISDKEVAHALAQRRKNFPGREAELQRDILLDGGCFNHSFIRNVYKELASTDGVLPIAIGESEYGQYGFTSKENENEILAIGKTGTTLGDLRKREKIYRNSNYTVFVPNQASQPQQVTEKDKKSQDMGRRSV